MKKQTSLKQTRMASGTACLAFLAMAVMLLLGWSRAQAGQNSSSGAQASAPSGNADNGKMLYTKIGCYECHDRDAEGAGTGPRLAPNPLPWTAFSRQVRNPVNSMPPYTAKVLADQELADIYAYLQTLPKPPALASIPLLQDSK